MIILLIKDKYAIPRKPLSPKDFMEKQKQSGGHRLKSIPNLVPR